MSTDLRLTAQELTAISTLWRAVQRDLVTSFGGRSMTPTIVDQQRVLFRCGVMPGIGDVAVLRFGDRLIVHRLAARSSTDSWILTWGDGNSLPDEPAPDPTSLIGTIVAAEQNGQMVPIPPLPNSLKRTAILRFAAPSDASYRTVAGRVRFLLRLRALLSMPLAMFLRTVVRVLSPSRKHGP